LALEVLSAGAVEPGLVAAVDSFRRAAGHEVSVRFATAPALRQKITAGEAADVLIAPQNVIAEFAKSGLVDGEHQALLGRVGVGVVVREGAPTPEVSTAEALKRAVTGAGSVVYNRASTGLYLDTLFQRLGISDEIAPKTTRYPDGASVMEHIAKGRPDEIGFGAVTEILLYRGKGVRFVGALPAEIQNTTAYAAAPVNRRGTAEEAAAFVQFLASPAARGIFASHGIE
jgi:molybdate transport system substrate-binding protein